MSLQYKHFSYGSEGLLTRYFKNITHVSKNSVLLDFTDTFLYRGKEKIDTHIFKLARWIPIYLQKKSISQKFLTLYNTLWKGNITSTLICLKKIYPSFVVCNHSLLIRFLHLILQLGGVLFNSHDSTRIKIGTDLGENTALFILTFNDLLHMKTELMQKSFSFRYWVLDNSIFFLQKLATDTISIGKAKSLESIWDKLNKLLFRPEMNLAHREKIVDQGAKQVFWKGKYTTNILEE